ncbi:MAG: SDR family NAD(P)-dependent oxidoreductase [Specibacter sp.]
MNSSHFGCRNRRSTMAKWTSADMPEMNGKTVLVTGGSSGIGFVAAREMAAAGADVTLGVRNVAKGRLAAKEMHGSIEVRELDVSDLSNIRAFAEAWAGPLDILVNNAGVMDIPLRRTSEGLDMQTATNSFGPFLLTNLLLPKITDRIVWITSQLHRMGHLHTGDLNWESRPYKSMDAYNDSKLQVVLFSLELQRRLEEAGSNVRSVLAHPGIATTALAAHSGANNINRFSFLLNDPAHGALPTLFAATQNVSGNAYVGPDGPGSIKGYPKVRKPGKAGLNAQSASQLWTAVSKRVGVPA